MPLEASQTQDRGNDLESSFRRAVCGEMIVQKLEQGIRNGKLPMAACNMRIKEGNCCRWPVSRCLAGVSMCNVFI